MLLLKGLAVKGSYVKKGGELGEMVLTSKVENFILSLEICRGSMGDLELGLKVPLIVGRTQPASKISHR